MKKIVLVILVITLIVVGYYYKDYLIKDSKVNTVETKKINIVEEILSYDNADFNSQFLSYIESNYDSSVLTKINSSLKENTYTRTLWHDLTGYSYQVLSDLANNENLSIIDSKMDTMSFVGDVSLADNYKIMPAYDERNKGISGILSSDVTNVFNSTFTVVNNEFTISDRGEPLVGKQYTFRANPSRLQIYHDMSVELVTLANNHIYDYGSDAFQDALKYLKEYNIPYIGAGSNIDEAKKPYYVVINGYKIAFVNATRAEKNIMTPEATEESGGVFRCYDPTELKKVLTDVKKQSDIVVLLVHWGAEGSHDLEDVQTTTSKEYIDSGADIIIGTHAHRLQGMEFYKNKLIAYNLGDFIFNAYTEETGILTVTISDKGKLTYKFIPCLQENEYTSFLDDSDKENLITEMNTWSINVFLDSDGNITEK